jgi:serine phosphatase RsbU (regulator of sigma subunit)
LAGGSATFTAAKTSVIHTFADFLSIQIVNARFQEERVHNLLVTRELEIAQRIQQSLLLQTLPQIPGLELTGYCESARQVGGDFYDVIKLSDQRLLLMISDVMGKGIPAAMFAVILRSLVRALREWADRPAELLARLNALLFEELSRVEMFITAQLVFVDLARQRYLCASAGHCPLLLITPATQSVQAISPEGMPLGVLPDTVFAEEPLALSPGSRLLLYTDGITEAVNAEGDLFGQARLIDWLQRRSRLDDPVTALREDLTAELRRFLGSLALNDDQTFLLLARNPPD